MNLFLEELNMNLSSCINTLAIASRAIASNQTTSNNLNYIIKKRFDKEGIEIPYPHVVTIKK